MQLFFVDPGDIRGRTAVIRGADAQHAARVLRLAPGDTLLIRDGRGREYPGTIGRVERETVEVALDAPRPAAGEPPVALHLVQALAKGERMDWAVQKAVELGVQVIWPVETARTVVDLSKRRAAHRRERWQRIVHETAKQAGRGTIPRVEAVLSLSDALTRARAKETSAADGSTGAPEEDVLGLFPWEEAREPGLKERLRGRRPPRRVIVAVGPEGGFTAREAAAAAALGYELVSLGPRILRTETVGSVVAAAVLYEWGDLGTAGTGTAGDPPSGGG